MHSFILYFYKCLHKLLKFGHIENHAMEDYYVKSVHILKTNFKSIQYEVEDNALN